MLYIIVMLLQSIKFVTVIVTQLHNKKNVIEVIKIS